LFNMFFFLQDMKFCLLYVPICWNDNQLLSLFNIFLFPKYLFDSFYFFETLLNSSFLSCDIFFISCISLSLSF
jgi:hypothetical protein